jgi:hypothetical protein
MHRFRWIFPFHAVILELFPGSITSYLILILQERQEGGTAPLICGAAPAGSAH